MNIDISPTKEQLGKTSAEFATKIIKENLATKESVNIILATGASQFETLKNLVAAPGIDWTRVTMFHLDEYVGIPVSHPASFRKYLKERFVDKVTGLKEAHFINGDSDDPQQECERLKKLISDVKIDVALVGIGENGHLAFNDPPADFETKEPYLVVELDEACRRQQMGEGWFPTIEDVPKKAISMSIHKIMDSDVIICSVPDERKAEAVKNCLEGEVTNLHPASILQNHPRCTAYLDKDSAGLLSRK